MDLKKWKIFRKLDPGFVDSVKRTYLFVICPFKTKGDSDGSSYCDGSVMQMKNGDVYFIALNSEILDLLGLTESDENMRPLMPKKVIGLCGLEMRDVRTEEYKVTVLTADGRVFQWGRVSRDSEWKTLTPSFVSGRLKCKRVVQIACGLWHTMALTEEGELYSWGSNTRGQLGIGSRIDHADPIQVSRSHGFDKKIVSVACGRETTFALDIKGNVWSWGSRHGALGYESAADQLSPKSVAVRNIRKIVAGTNMVLALSVKNELYFWASTSCGYIATDPIKITTEKVLDVAATRDCTISAFTTIGCHVFFWGFAYGLHIPDPILTKFATMVELFASLDAPMMLEPMENPENEPVRVEKFRQSFDDHETGDLVFHVDGKRIYAHKVVLRIRSDYYGKMFANNWKESVEEKTVFEVKDFTYEGFRTFLMYLYTEQIQPPPQNVADVIELFKLAHYYGEEDLKRRCQQQLEVLTTRDNVCKVYPIAVLYGSEVLLDLVRTIIAPNLNAVLKTDGYKEMQPELRMRLIHEGGSIKRRRVEVE